MAPNFKYFLPTLLLIHTLVVSVRGTDSELIFVSPQGKTLSGEDFDPSSLAKTAATTATAAAQSGSTAAQAISAAAQAGMMYRILMAQGVMDYLHRKQLDKANQKMAQKMEKLEKELISGKLNAAQFAAIKSAVDEAYQKHAKSNSPQERSVNPDFEKSENLDNLKMGVASPESQLSLLQGGNSDAISQSAPAPSDWVDHDSLNHGPKLEKPNSGLKNSDYAPTNTQPNIAMAPSIFSLGQGSVILPSSDPSDPSTRTVIHEKEEKRTFTQETQLQLNSQGETEGVDLSSAFDDRLKDEFRYGTRSEGEYLRSLSEVNSPKVTKPLKTAEMAGALKNLLKPIKIQKSLFSLEPYSEEEGLHWGFLILGLAVAYGWGKKKASVKSKIPHIIPEVVLAPQKSKNRGLKDRRQITRG